MALKFSVKLLRAFSVPSSIYSCTYGYDDRLPPTSPTLYTLWQLREPSTLKKRAQIQVQVPVDLLRGNVQLLG